MQRTISVLALGALLTGVPGCMEDIALIGRPTIPEGQQDLVGAVDHVDVASRRIYLRSSGDEHRGIAYSADARVLDYGREYPMTRLAPGDVVAMQMRRDLRGDSYVELVRIQENVGNRSREEAAVSAPRIQTLVGRVESVDRQDNSFDVNNQLGQKVMVTLSEYARESDRDRFRTLRSGDHVRVEGKFTRRGRFEMLSFLNDE